MHDGMDGPRLAKVGAPDEERNGQRHGVGGQRSRDLSTGDVLRLLAYAPLTCSSR
jgi:hypothetical protein